MSDAELRELERRWRETGSVEDEAAYLVAAVRAGVRSRSSVEAEAARGATGARRALAMLPEALLVVHFWAEWNGLDRRVSALLSELQGRLQGWLLHPVDVDRDPDFPSACGIPNLPALVAFRRGEEVSRMIGTGDVEAWLRRALASGVEETAT